MGGAELSSWTGSTSAKLVRRKEFDEFRDKQRTVLQVNPRPRRRGSCVSVRWKGYSIWVVLFGSLLQGSETVN